MSNLQSVTADRLQREFRDLGPFAISALYIQYCNAGLYLSERLRDLDVINYLKPDFITIVRGQLGRSTKPESDNFSRRRDQFLVLAAEAANALLPADPLHNNSPEEIWLRKLFELGLKKLPGSALALDKFVCLGDPNIRVKVADWPSYRANCASFPMSSEMRDNFAILPNDNPPWFSRIDDLAAASVSAIDILLSRYSTDSPPVRSPWNRHRYQKWDGTCLEMHIPFTRISGDGSPQESVPINRDAFSELERWAAIDGPDDNCDEFLIRWIDENQQTHWLKFRQNKQSMEIHPPVIFPLVDENSKVIELTNEQARKWFDSQKLAVPAELITLAHSVPQAKPPVGGAYNFAGNQGPITFVNQHVETPIGSPATVHVGSSSPPTKKPECRENWFLKSVKTGIGKIVIAAIVTLGTAAIGYIQGWFGSRVTPSNHPAPTDPATSRPSH